MKTIPSPQFRRTYQRLTEKVTVTVHGHPIGVWEPYTPGKHNVDRDDKISQPNEAKEEKESP